MLLEQREKWPWLHTHIVIPILLYLTILVALLITMNEMNSTAQSPSQLPVSEEKYTASSRVNTHYSFTAPSSYFLPSLPSTNPATFDPTTTNFGLISQSYESDSSLPLLHFGDHHVGKPTDWQRFDHHLKTLSTQADANTSYHILYLARHGQGYHNLAESYYGPAAWDCHWAELDGDPDPTSTITWSDAHLSKLGQRQAHEQSKFWTFQLSEQGMPPPGTWFVSPMNRACKTLEITFQPLAEAGVVQDWKPTVKEYLRETNGIHTCDRRSLRSVIADTFPQYIIESDFTEQDELWDPIYRETDTAHTHRAALVLDDILSSTLTGTSKANSYISITAHGGMINAILRAIGHRQFTVRVGSAIAVLVKAERLDDKRPEQHFDNGSMKPECVEDPMKAGLPGYKSLKEYVDSVEAGA